MPLNALPDDFYDYDEQTQSLQGRHNGWQFTVGMHVRVKVTEVTPVSGGILVEWVKGGLRSDQQKRESHNYLKKRSGKIVMNARGQGTGNGKPRRASGKGGKRKRR